MPADAVISSPNLPLKLSQVRERLLIHFRPVLSSHGLTEPQWRILRVLCERDGQEPRELCETCQFLSPSMAGMLKRMEEMNLIRRKAVKQDKRRVRVFLTAKSRRLVGQLAPLIESQYRQIETAIGSELVARLDQVLDEYLAASGSPTR